MHRHTKTIGACDHNNKNVEEVRVLLVEVRLTSRQGDIAGKRGWRMLFSSVNWNHPYDNEAAIEDQSKKLPGPRASETISAGFER